MRLEYKNKMKFNWRLFWIGAGQVSGWICIAIVIGLFIYGIYLMF